MVTFRPSSIRPCLLAASLVLAAGTASAQTADELVAKHLEARGGLARLKAIETVRIERTVAATFNDIDVVIYKKRPDLYRSEQRVEGSPNVTVRGFADTAWETVSGKTTARQGAGPAEQREPAGRHDDHLRRLARRERRRVPVRHRGGTRRAGADVFYTKKIEVNVPMDDAMFRMPT